ncbi:hypothetical protein EVAR_63756_1 [Eumeta japonica]|uniref:Uncharacterized protein n=1 Tax=Eumeta variegata TaxID=151549 RepID=A0A4C1ZSF6_EUMVA|nr:hypothetical protein EVAR_63756_1 [Eumeta japonica]
MDLIQYRIVTSPTPRRGRLPRAGRPHLTFRCGRPRPRPLDRRVVLDFAYIYARLRPSRGGSSRGRDDSRHETARASTSAAAYVISWYLDRRPRRACSVCAAESGAPLFVDLIRAARKRIAYFRDGVPVNLYVFHSILF